jgi:hypothetical protein
MDRSKNGLRFWAELVMLVPVYACFDFKSNNTLDGLPAHVVDAQAASPPFTGLKTSHPALMAPGNAVSKMSCDIGEWTSLSCAVWG